MPTLLDLTAEQMELDDLLEQLGGEVPDDEVGAALEAFLERHGRELSAKLDAYAGVIAEREAHAEFRRAEAKRLTALAMQDESRADFMRERLKVFFERTGRQKVETPLHKFSLVKNGGKAPLLLTPDLRPESIPGNTGSSDTKWTRRPCGARSKRAKP
jgi:hypothetical protein